MELAPNCPSDACGRLFQHRSKAAVLDRCLLSSPHASQSARCLRLAVSCRHSRICLRIRSCRCHRRSARGSSSAWRSQILTPWRPSACAPRSRHAWVANLRTRPAGAPPKQAELQGEAQPIRADRREVAVVRLRRAGVQPSRCAQLELIAPARHLQGSVDPGPPRPRTRRRSVNGCSGSRPTTRGASATFPLQPCDTAHPCQRLPC